MESTMVEELQKITPTKEQLELFIALVRRVYYKRIASLQKKRDSADQEIKRLTDLRQSLIEKNLAGIYSDDIFKEQNLPPMGTFNSWFWIPTWSAGTWHRETQTDFLATGAVPWLRLHSIVRNYLDCRFPAKQEEHAK